MNNFFVRRLAVRFAFAAALAAAGCDDASHRVVGPEDDLCEVIEDVRRSRKAGRIPSGRQVRIELKPGTYRLGEALVLTEEDSNLSISAVKTGSAVLSGGLELPEFVCSDSGVWKTVVPAGLKFDQLWVGGRFATRARTPDAGFAYMHSPCEEAKDPATGKVIDQSKRAFVCGGREADMLEREIAASGGVGDVYVRIYQMWVMGLHRMVSYDPKTRIAKITPETERTVLNGWGLTTAYALENMRTALDAPGEWYHDAEKGELLYVPRPGERPETAKAVVPVSTRILHVSGRNIAFKGVTFAYCGYDVTKGDVGVQAQYMAPAAVEVVSSRDVEFVSCSFCCLAPVALRINGGSRGVRVAGSLFDEFGVGGIYIGDWNKNLPVASHVSVTDTLIRGGGRVMVGGVGVWIGFAADVDIIHNEICDLGYSGVSSGWVWGYADTPTARIRINNNYIHDIGYCIISDMGGIYTLGNHPDSEAIGNHIHDIWSSDLDGRGSWGLYADEGTSGMRFESNLVYRTKTGSFHQHYGKDNVVRNNIFAYAREFPVERTRIEGHRSFVFEDNIVLWTNDTQAVRSRRPGNLPDTVKGLVFDRNVYFNPHGVDDKAFHGYPFAEWRKCGMDKNGSAADPMLEDPADGRWMPLPGSPVWKTRFGKFDPGAAGVRPDTANPAWAGVVRSEYPKPSLPGPLPLTCRGNYSNDFEGYAPGMLPLAFKYQCPTNSAGEGGVRIASVAGARGGHALEFADAAGLGQRGVPHVNGYFGATAGVYRVAFSVCAEKGAEMDFSIRGETPDFPFGVLVRYAGEKLSVNGKELARIPPGVWWRLSVEVDVDRPVLDWRVKAERGGAVLAETSVPSRDPKCRVPGWFGWNSNAESGVRFYVDDLEVDTQPGLRGKRR